MRQPPRDAARARWAPDSMLIGGISCCDAARARSLQTPLLIAATPPHPARVSRPMSCAARRFRPRRRFFWLEGVCSLCRRRGGGALLLSPGLDAGGPAGRRSSFAAGGRPCGRSALHCMHIPLYLVSNAQSNRMPGGRRGRMPGTRTARDHGWDGRVACARAIAARRMLRGQVWCARVGCCMVLCVWQHSVRRSGGGSVARLRDRQVAVAAAVRWWLQCFVNHGSTALCCT